MLHCEYVYCRTHIRVKEYTKQWNINTDLIHAVVREKMRLVITARVILTMFTSIDEDESACKEH